VKRRSRVERGRKETGGKGTENRMAVRGSREREARREQKEEKEYSRDGEGKGR
jgi:hypothetical protein